MLSLNFESTWTLGLIMKKTLAFILFHASFFVLAQEVGSFTDARDGNVYGFVTYTINLSDGTQSTLTWMSENLKYNIENSRCYDNSQTNCEQYGRQYMYAEAINACPEGWHLPSDEEWYSLANIYDGIPSAGQHLKSKSELWGNGIGTNKSLFNAIPNQPVKAHKIKNMPQPQPSAVFWSSTIKNAKYAWDWKLVAGWNKMQRWEGSKKEFNCVRCVKN